MPNEIQRYGVRHEVFKPTPEGEFVTYKDYKQHVDKLNKEISDMWHHMRKEQVPYEQYYGR